MSTLEPFLLTPQAPLSVCRQKGRMTLGQEPCCSVLWGFLEKRLVYPTAIGVYVPFRTNGQATAQAIHQETLDSGRLQMTQNHGGVESQQTDFPLICVHTMRSPCTQQCVRRGLH